MNFYAIFAKLISFLSMTGNQPRNITSYFVKYFCSAKSAVVLCTGCDDFIKYFGLLANTTFSKSILRRTEDSARFFLIL